MKKSDAVTFELRNDDDVSYVFTEDEMITIIYNTMVNSMYLEGDKAPFEGQDPIETMHSFEKSYYHY
ncbi:MULTISPECIES: hypothetical protein [Enterobacteriaceae]|jgi:hypothetical protein|uniref:hypothetical protein n=1 Tax=Enterobacteriaceae TaxID=543 RepID=UPI0015611590|nr:MULTISPECIES: hypothetical protein [Enterobacteriaceae]EIY5102185.1 hypothetical protein [Klebsiella variicola]MDR6246846.1 hypothetical protein [Klebsiella variicola]MDR6252380.1 hypothetical protein [Klebsiella variicola]MDR6257805.1 hypothetical protein [Klebsiella sp. SORGH_AS_0826]MDR6271490.1 hypothetical protein [Klebsiella variicola]